MITVALHWEGPGWYASAHHGWDYVRSYRFGDDPDEIPYTYIHGYGTPMWYDEPPEGWIDHDEQEGYDVYIYQY
jgi:hypothetical protein